MCHVYGDGSVAMAHTHIDHLRWGGLKGGPFEEKEEEDQATKSSGHGVVVMLVKTKLVLWASGQIRIS